MNTNKTDRPIVKCSSVKGGKKETPVDGKGSKGKHAVKIVFGIVIFLNLATFLLELVPNAVLLPFASGPGQWVTEGFSYFSLTPFGYAEYLPLLTGILTVAAAFLCLACLFQKAIKNRTRTAAFVCDLAALLANIFFVVKNGMLHATGWNIAVLGVLLLAVILVSLAGRFSKNRRKS